jgi:hypothetical protein
LNPRSISPPQLLRNVSALSASHHSQQVFI